MFKKVRVTNGKVTESCFVEGMMDKSNMHCIKSMGILIDDKKSITETKEGADWSRYEIPDGEYLLGFKHFGVYKAIEFFSGCELYPTPAAC